MKNSLDKLDYNPYNIRITYINNTIMELVMAYMRILYKNSVCMLYVQYMY